MLYKFLLPFSLWLIANTLFAQPALDARRQGDKAYDKSNYEQAEKAYKKAENTPEADYNRGNTIYQQGRYKDAQPLYESALKNAKTPESKADILHNLGNTHLKNQQYKEAVNAYEKSLRLRPGDPGTKQNLQFAKRMLQKQEEEQKKQQQNQQQQNQQQPKDKDQQQQNQQQQNNQQQPKDKDQQQQNQQQQQPNQDTQKEQPQPGQMTKEDARRLLETAISPEDRKNTRKYRERQQQNPTKKAKEKDW
jgi:Ca-activated chloride channel homolog